MQPVASDGKIIKFIPFLRHLNRRKGVFGKHEQRGALRRIYLSPQAVDLISRAVITNDHNLDDSQQ